MKIGMVRPLPIKASHVCQRRSTTSRNNKSRNDHTMRCIRISMGGTADRALK